MDQIYLAKISPLHVNIYDFIYRKLDLFLVFQLQDFYVKTH